MLLLLIACNSEGHKQPDLDHDDDGFTVTEKDCDDTNNHIYPNADDVVGDDEDRNCDGVDGVDADGDGWASQASGGTDCNDEDTGIPGTESYNNNIDDNCNGCIDEPVWTLGIVSSPGISQIIVDTFHKDRQKFDFSFGFIQGNYRSESCEDGHSNCHIGSDTLTLDVVSRCLGRHHPAEPE